jgi:hypothetical protein
MRLFLALLEPPRERPPQALMASKSPALGPRTGSPHHPTPGQHPGALHRRPGGSGTRLPRGPAFPLPRPWERVSADVFVSRNACD